MIDLTYCMPAHDSPLPLPPLALRQLVGLSGKNAFDNSTNTPLFPDVPVELYEAVFDFGCGCGRLARQLIQQHPRPRHYVGIDIHQEMIAWAQKNLIPYAPGFEFYYQDVYNPHLNPKGSCETFSFPAQDSSMSLLLAISVFTHLLESQIVFYLREAARIMRPDGLLISTWFLFEKRFFPMLLPQQNFLYINDKDPRNAVIVDRTWLNEVSNQVGLVPVKIIPPSIRGFQWFIYFSLAASGQSPASWPIDDAPFGSVEPERGIILDQQI